MPIVNRIAEFHREMTEWRRDLHMHPELMYDVQRTAGTVAEKAPLDPAVVLVTVAASPVVVSAAWIDTAEPGVVVPVTTVVAVVSVLPAAGAVIVTGSEPGAPPVR